MIRSSRACGCSKYCSQGIFMLVWQNVPSGQNLLTLPAILNYTTITLNLANCFY